MKTAHLQFSLSLTLALGLSTSISTFAKGPGPGGGHARPVHARTPLIHEREGAQQARIAEGVRSGELTGAEAKQLRSEEKGIREDAKAARADGVVTPAERNSLQQELNQTSKDIYQDKHNAEKGVPMPPPLPRPPGAPLSWRQHEQNHRIAQGVRSGQLTKEEAKGLRQSEKSVRSEAKEFRSDGQVTSEERQKLRSDLNDASQKIFQEKHDGDTVAKP